MNEKLEVLDCLATITFATHKSNSHENHKRYFIFRQKSLN